MQIVLISSFAQGKYFQIFRLIISIFNGLLTERCLKIAVIFNQAQVIVDWVEKYEKNILDFVPVRSFIWGPLTSYLWPLKAKNCDFQSSYKLKMQRESWRFFNTVKVPERVQFWHENVHLSANQSTAFLTRRAVIGWKLYIFMPKSYTFRNFDGMQWMSALTSPFSSCSQVPLSN